MKYSINQVEIIDAEEAYFEVLYTEEIHYNKGDIVVITDGFLEGEICTISHYSTLEDMYVVKRANGERTLIFKEDLKHVKGDVSMTSKMLKETALAIFEEYTRQHTLGNEIIASNLAEEFIYFVEAEQGNMNPLDLKTLRKLVVSSHS